MMPLIAYLIEVVEYYTNEGIDRMSANTWKELKETAAQAAALLSC